MREIIVDNFAGGGGASTGIELAIGRSVDIAINHDPAAIAMHKANHPTSKHYCENVWDVDPVEACAGRPVGLAWFSPDCKHFSKAKGSKPVEKKIRGLAWIALKWAGKVRPRVIILENVEEFKTWGPIRKGKPIKNKAGQTFELWKSQLESLGYKIEHRELIACDYGAPTIRKRFFLIARCDGKQIIWPEATHASPKTLEVQMGLLKPWRAASEIIDWSIPMKSIFDRKKPLVENTLKRIAKGVQKYVIENANPFIIQYHSFKGQDFRGQELDRPLNTIDTSNRYGLVIPFISKYFGGYYDGAGSDIQEPLHTLTTKDRNALVTAFISRQFGTSIGHEMEQPLGTCTTVNKSSLVTAFLMTYYGNGADVGQNLDEPLRTITTKDRFGLVTIQGQDYQIVDICMRMLAPRELFDATGFPSDYIIDHDFDGKQYPKTEQTARCGNAVPPPFAEALTKANIPEYCIAEKAS